MLDRKTRIPIMRAMQNSEFTFEGLPERNVTHSLDSTTSSHHIIREIRIINLKLSDQAPLSPSHKSGYFLGLQLLTDRNLEQRVLELEDDKTQGQVQQLNQMTQWGWIVRVV